MGINSMQRKQCRLLIVLSFVTFLLLHVHSQNTTVEEYEKTILLELKTYLSNSSYMKQQWSLSSPYCSWPGISCSHGGSVTSIHLEGGNLTEIPPIICKLKNLTVVELGSSYLSGLFPTALCNCTKLEVLDLSLNHFHGPLPTDIHRMSSLTILYLGLNNFNGTIPDELGTLKSLRVLDLRYNSLSGQFPTALYNCTKLEILALSENQLHGPLPLDIHRMSSLTTLYLSLNNFNGTIPGAVGQLSKLKYLSLGSNYFKGSIPREIGNLSNLEELHMSELKKFENATILDELGKLKNLRYLFLSHSNLIENIPEALSSVSCLEKLDLSNNYLTGPIPASLFGLENLTSLYLNDNELNGSLPTCIGELKLDIIDLHGNKLSGKIPIEFEEHSNYYFFDNFNLSTSDSSDLHLCANKKFDKTIIISPIAAGVLVMVVLVCISYNILKHSKLRLSRRSWTKKQKIDDWKFISFQRTNFRQTEILMNLTEENLIGSGGCGSVYQIAINENTSHVAVKRIRNENNLDSSLEKQFFAELQILGEIRHVNIVKLLCCISNEKTKILVYEYMENHSLDKWLHPKRRRDQLQVSLATHVILDWGTRLQIAIGAARGLCYMHHDCSPPIIHRDIKSSNILLDNELNAKVADFGLARVLSKHGHTETTSIVAGTFGYIAPEYAYSSKVSMKGDVYSFGVVLLELVTGREPVSRDDHMNLAQRSWKHIEEDKCIEDALDEDIKELANTKAMREVFKLGLMCTNNVASNRPSMKEVVQVLLLLTSY